MLPEFASALRGLAVSENIVHFAALLYLSGFLFRDQLLLRILIVAGDIVHVFYPLKTCRAARGASTVPSTPR